MDFLRKMQVKSLFFLASGSIVIIITIISLYNLWNSYKVKNLSEAIVQRNFQRYSLIIDILKREEQNFSFNLQIVFIDNVELKTYLEKKLEENKLKVTEDFSSLKTLLEREEGKQKVNALEKIKNEYESLSLKSKETLFINKNRELAEQIFQKEAIPKYGEYRNLISDFQNFQDELFMERISQIDSYLQGSFIFNISSFLIMLAVALLAGYFTSNIVITQIDEINQIAKKLSEGDLSIKIESQNQNEFDTLKSSLNKTKENLCSVVSSIQTTLKELNQKALRLDSIAKRFSDTAQKQAASSEETSATIEELSSSFDSVVQTIQTSNKSLKVVDSKSQNLNESLALAGRGLKDVAKRSSETSSAAEAGRSNIESTNESMKKILDTSQKISNLVGIITEISDQTNLLALNAAIEAARAGDAGRGFAVVATEVAKLAERTATNVKDIKALIHSVNQAIKEGVTNVENSSSFFEKIIESIQRITEESTKVIDSIQKQFSTMEEIAREINQISTMYTEMESAIVEQKEATYQMNTVSQELTSDAQELSASAQEIDSSSSEIKQLSQALAKKVQFFKLNN